jgi:hypothetical protein
VPIAQSVKVSGGAGPSAGINVAAGSTVVVVTTGGSGSAYTPTDNGGNTWPGSPAVNFDSAGARLTMWVLQNCAAKTGYQVTVASASGDAVFTVHEVTGVLAASLDSAATASGSGAEPFTLNAASALAQAANTVISGMLPYMSGDPVTYAANTGYAIAAQENNNNSFYGQGVASKSVSSTAAPSVQWDTSGATGDVFVGIIVLKEAAAGGVTGAGQIASAEAFGSPAVGATVAAAGIASAQAVGAPAVGARISAAGIGSGEAIGSPAVGAAINAVGIASAEAFGAPVVGGSGIFAAGIPSAEAFGQPALAARINAAGITSGEVFGQPTVGTPAPAPARLGGYELSGAREVSFKPLMQRVLEARSAKRVKPAKERAQKRAKVIEVEAAQVALEDGAEARFRELMDSWLAQRPVMPRGLDPQQLFLAQVAFRIQQMQAEQQARAVVERQIAAQIDEEEALIALLLA